SARREDGPGVGVGQSGRRNVLPALEHLSDALQSAGVADDNLSAARTHWPRIDCVLDRHSCRVPGVRFAIQGRSWRIRHVDWTAGEGISAVKKSEEQDQSKLARSLHCILAKS